MADVTDQVIRRDRDDSTVAQFESRPPGCHRDRLDRARPGRGHRRDLCAGPVRDAGGDPAAVIVGVSADLPHTDQLPAGQRTDLPAGQPLVAAIAAQVVLAGRVHGPANIPAARPVILAANHLGAAGRSGAGGGDPTTDVRHGQARDLRRIAGPAARPARADLDEPPVRSTRRRSAGPSRCCGPTRCWPFFPRASAAAGEVAWAKGGAAYLAMVAGAPIVPVAHAGHPRAGSDQEPAAASRRADPRRLRAAARSARASPGPAARRWSRSTPSGCAASLAAHVVAAQALTGLPLPGPPKPKPARNPSPADEHSLRS